MKPPGIAMDLVGSALGLRLKMPSAAEDKIWEAVEAAIDAGWDARRFRIEAASAWEEELRKRAKWAVDDLVKP